jgi:formylglycine-generating enzyme required for sulfatase activity
MLLNSIYIAERQGQPKPQPVQVAKAAVSPPKLNPATVIDEVADAFNADDFDRAVFLLKQAKDKGYKSRFINIEAVLQEAEEALEHQAYLREAEREYRPIVALIKRAKTRKMGCEAFTAFKQHFPDYDPANIAAVCAEEIMPTLTWCDIPAGEVTIDYEHRSVTYYVEGFKISQYPITNAQFKAFLDDEHGYRDSVWWEFLPEAHEWRSRNDQPLPPKFAWGDHPRHNINWYEAMAFCQWWSDKSGTKVTLPTEQQWQRAAQGDDARLYPWGNRFDRSRCNTRESKLRTTCSVTRYENDASPYGVHGMAGNVWQWCHNTDPNLNTSPNKGRALPRAVRGGSYISVAQRSRTNFHFYLNPLYQYATIGFRVVSAN